MLPYVYDLWCHVFTPSTVIYLNVCLCYLVRGCCVYQTRMEKDCISSIKSTFPFRVFYSCFFLSGRLKIN